MARCGCASECSCVIVDGDCITIAGSGNPANPFAIGLELDPASNNQATCGTDGLLVEPPAAGDCILVDDTVVPARISVEVDPDAENQLVCNTDGLFVLPTIEVADTDCIDLEGTGSPVDPLTATPIISPDPANQLECVAAPSPNQGLRARAYVIGSTCVDVTGTGTLSDPFEVDLDISGDPGNILQCRPTGAFVPTAGAGAVDIYGAIDLTAGFVSPGGTPFVALSPFPFNRLIYDVGGIVDIANSQFLIPPGGDGWYWIEAQWYDNTIANNFQSGLFGGFFQQEFSLTVTSTTPIFVPGPFSTQDRLVESPHHYRLTALRYMEAGDVAYANWTISNTTGAACGPMAFDPIPSPMNRNYMTIARVGV